MIEWSQVRFPRVSKNDFSVSLIDVMINAPMASLDLEWAIKSDGQT